MAQYDGSIRINTQLNTNGFERGARGLISGMTRLGNSLRGMVSSLGFGLGIAGLVALGKQAIDTASDIQEVQNVVDTAFGSMSYKMEEFAKTSVKQFGISQLSAKQLGSTFMAMGASMLDSAETASDMAINLTARAADMASFYNKSIEETSTALKSIYTGETESLKEYGVVMTQVNLEEFARQQGINKSIQAMTQAEKVQLQYAYVMQQTALAAGDFARTSDSWANQTRILKEQFKELASVIGGGLIAALTPVVKFLNTILTQAIAIAKQIGALLGKLFGISVPVASAAKGASGIASGMSDAAKSTSGIASGMSDVANNMDSAAGSAGGLKKGIESAGKAAKKAGDAAKRSLAPFDKLTVLSKEASGAGGGGSGGGGSGGGGGAGGAGGGGFAMPQVELKDEAQEADELGGALDGILDKLKELKDLFVEGFFDGLGDYKPALKDINGDLNSIWKTLKDIFTDPEVVSAADNFLNSMAFALGQVAGSFTSIGLTIARNIIGGIEKYLTQNVERIKKYIIGMFDIGSDIASIIGNFAVAVADIISVFGSELAQQITANIIGIFAEIGMMISETALKLGRDILNMITQPIIDNKDKIKTAIEGTLEAIEPFTSGLLTAVQTIRDAVTTIYDEHLKPLFDSIAEGISIVLGKLLDGYNTYIVPVLQGLGDRFKEIMEGPFGDTVDKIVEFVGKLIDAFKLLWESALVPLFSWIADNIMPVLAPIVDFIGNAVMTALETVINVIGDIADVLSGVIDFVVGVFTGDWEKAWNGIGEIFSAVLDGIMAVLEGAFDVLISFGEDIVGGMLKGIKNAIKGIGKWVIDNIINPFLMGFKSALGIHSPSTVMAEQGGYIIDGLLKGIKDSWKGFIDFWTQKITDIVDGFKDIKDKFLEKGKNIVEGIKSGISEKWSGFTDFWSEKKNNVVDKFKDIKEKFATKGNNIISGIKSGISQNWGAFSSYWSEKKTNIVDKFKDIKEKFTTKGGNIVSGIKGGISGAWSGFSSFWTNKKNSIFKIFSNVGSEMAKIGKNIVNGLIDGIKSVWSKITGIAGNIKDAITGAVSGSKSAVSGAEASSAATYSVSYSAMPEPAFMDIPKLASGAVIRGGDPFMAVLGDQPRGQTNIEAPLATIEKALANVMKNNGGAGGDVTVKVYLDGKDVTKSVKTEADTYFKRTGRPLFGY